jgi:4-oxalocrotonate tautomerase
MPLIEISLADGRTPEQVRALIHAVHAATRDALDADERSIRIIVREVPRTHWAAGDVTLAERDSPAAAPDDMRQLSIGS